MKKNKNIFLFCLSHNVLNNTWNNLKFWVSLLFTLVYHSLKFQVNRKHGVLNPSDLPWNTPYCNFIIFLTLWVIDEFIKLDQKHEVGDYSNCGFCYMRRNKDFIYLFTLYFYHGELSFYINCVLPTVPRINLLPFFW